MIIFTVIFKLLFILFFVLYAMKTSYMIDDIVGFVGHIFMMLAVVSMGWLPIVFSAVFIFLALLFYWIGYYVLLERYGI